MRPVHAVRAGLWCAGGHTGPAILDHLVRKVVPPGTLEVLGAQWPYGFAAPARVPAMDRLGLALDALAGPLDRASLPGGVPVFAGSSSLLVGALEEAWPALAGAGVDGLEQALRNRWPALGPVWTFSGGCTSAVQALHAAHALVASGARDEALVLGVELLNRITPAGFASLQLLSPDRCRPLDAGRNGLVLGEAVAAVVLRAGTGPWRLHPPALGLDQASPTGFQEDGATLARVMVEALGRARVAPHEVRAVKLQAAGSPSTDAVEVRALDQVFPGGRPECLTLKASLGHSLGASGLAEMAALMLCGEAGCLPPSAGFQDADPSLGLVPTRAPVPFDRGAILLNIQGFGGGLGSWVLERT